MQKQDDDLVLTFSRPQTVQIMQRRHFHRYTPGQSFPVFVSWQEIEGESSDIKTPALGQVRDLSLQGMSIQVPENLDQHLFIGDTVYVRFSLNVRDPEYFTSATICHKDFNKDKLELVIGLQFLDTEENGEFQTRLRSVLNQTFVTKKGQ
jgi:c-di-GMP-binding flagellar brake protein YcgR